MTFAVGHVEGGTHAGWRKTRQKPGRWTCECGRRVWMSSGTPGNEGLVRIPRRNPGYLIRCPDCHAVRP